MTDKEQIICKYKFQDKENFAKDINVPSKEQIMTDINKCKFRDKYTNYCLAERDDIGESYTICTGTNCYFKQLARKTQECEELKKYIQEREVWGDDCEFCKHNDKENCHQNIILDNLKTINRYRKALEEIEKLTKDQVKWAFEASRKCAEQILDIINKAKGEQDDLYT